MYYNDEVGGIQLDGSWAQFFSNASDNLANSDFPAMRALKDIETKLKFYRDTNSTPDNYDMEANFFINQVLSWYPGSRRAKQKQRDLIYV